MSDPIKLRLFREYQDRIPGHRGGGRTALSTFIRWATDGVKLPDGSRLRLRAQRCGHKWLTTDEWFDDFLNAQTAPFQTTSTPTRSPAERSRAAEAAGKRLQAAGA